MQPPNAQEQWNQHGFVVLKQVVSPEMCQMLCDYVHLKARVRPNIKKNDALTGVHREYADPLMETLLDKLTDQVEVATGLSLWPTLSFYYLYRQGNELTPHKDRSSCQIVAGLCIGSDKAFQQGKGSWPLVLDCHGKPVPVHLNPGDLLIFKGHETTHWREVFQGAWFVSAIFGYVEKKGPFAFQKYDQRKQVGMPHIGMFHWLYGCIKNKATTQIARLKKEVLQKQ